ncbi:MAG: hypothetical protein DRN37_01480 [Thermoplasmata archaeon]|nr:MAG: hypothetical protein DRN37_01480 [Thermoplasmata archaeon]
MPVTIYSIMEAIVGRYGKIEDFLRFITASAIRTKLLLSVACSPMTSTHLKHTLSTNTSTVIHAARDLERKGLIVETPEGYSLTSMGTLLTLKISELVDMMETIKKNEDFWKVHKLDDIPTQFLRTLYMLNDHEIIVSEASSDIIKAVSVYAELVQNAREFYGLSPVFYEQLVPLLKQLCRTATSIHLIVTEPVFNVLREKNAHPLSQMLATPSFSLWVTGEHMPITLTVTDSFLSMGLFKHDGTYDMAQSLISHSEKALEWGKNFFTHYQGRANPVSASEI